jgi:hypothetical protein
LGLSTSPVYSFGWWLMAGAGLLREKSTAGWLLMSDDWFVLREKYCWLVADKSNEQGARSSIPFHSPQHK